MNEHMPPSSQTIAFCNPFMSTTILCSCWSAEKRGSQPDDEPRNHALGLFRGGFGSKLHGRGNVLQVIVTRGNRNECPIVGPLVGSTFANTGGRWPNRGRQGIQLGQDPPVAQGPRRRGGDPAA